MDQPELQKRVEAFLKDLGIPSFIVFGFQKSEKEFGFIWSHHQAPSNVVIKGLSWALHDFVQKKL
ncbi:MAG: hypothetical protein PeribacterA2_0137 [Candidatus Peribacter riflensis]|uniref:Uncharacterized protein n=1 Tax=Candidatus Peribacter riflensis TaxID=1735162 RepID=A0A0S1SMT5_9BACT|nr:MAG: hypothetical protein PeribacterA2_0137 [Candidatus Peribacter riflensis]OGJ76712.1 MAG: hypothetical protein A2398_03740 [Candidatus Peribacteria bacterium RIFOXYB1_FULL_57_12]OGJ82067.1 MAG: hypothetical protein A2412_05160 [Candidatus Peribacteria bacterium RIFOXYC1_FULL_58_8]ALM10634.1 MAG: hypothetical protein PeribacterB2_0137 [Candidatus Peribacter riflensis]ALM11736.1 MAG: hypothetical protein PeribacterC2_0136 [Candidatus Peribacter riflensis]